jgi:hypothetical protein
VLSEKKILNETKNHNPPPFNLNGRSLSCVTSVCKQQTTSEICGSNFYDRR